MNLTARENNLTSPPPVSAENIGADEIFYPESDGKPMAETEIHIKTIISLYTALEMFFGEDSDFRVFSDIMFYYEEGDPRKCIAPDVMVVKGVNKNPRRVFRLWEEKQPEVVFEISSHSTWREDLQKKYFLYQEFGVKEYYIFDPEYDYLKDEFLVAYHLKDGELKEVKLQKGSVYSPALNLVLVNTGETLRLLNPESGKFLPTTLELSGENSELASEILELISKNSELNNENQILADELRQKDAVIEKLKTELAKLKR